MFDEKPEKTDYWVSYTDLLTGSLAVFMLIAVVLLAQQPKTVTGTLAGSGSFKTILLDSAIAGTAGMNLTVNIKKITDTAVVDGEGIIIEMADEFKAAFKDFPQIAVSEDATIRILTGDVADGVFSNGSAVINPSGWPVLNIVVYKFLEVLEKKNQKIKNLPISFKEIRIEGHASNDGAYWKNLNLSSQRALAVSQYIINSPAFFEMPKPFQEMFLEKFLACGYSYSKTLDANGKPTKISGQEENKPQSRRVEFRVLLESTQGPQKSP